MVLAHTATACRQYFHPWIIKKRDLETVSHFATPNQRQIQKMSPKWVLRGLPKWSLKSTKMETWTSRCLLGVPVDPWITKMITQGTKMESQGLQNVSFGVKK